MANQGIFDPTLVAAGWFDPSAVASGLFDADLLESGTVAPSSWSATGSGGLQFAGSGLASKGKTCFASGGALLSGMALTLKQAGTQSYAYNASGGLQAAGAALTSKGKTTLASGGLQCSGIAVNAKTKAFFSNGGFALGGEAIPAKTRTMLPTGGLLAAGSASANKGKTYLASGGALFAGSAPASFASIPSATWAYVGNGLVQLAGSALTGFAPAAVEMLPVPYVSGSQFRRLPAARVFHHVASGGTSFAGTAATRHDPNPAEAWTIIAAARLHLSGKAPTAFHDPYAQARAEDEWLILL